MTGRFAQEIMEKSPSRPSKQPVGQEALLTGVDEQGQKPVLVLHLLTLKSSA
jgi:hypothetical protein